VDKITGQRMAPITTGQIYWGAVPFVVIQIIMVCIVLAFPGLVTGNLDKLKVDPSAIEITIPDSGYDQEQAAPGESKAGDQPPAENKGADKDSDLEDLFKK
jgi:hypothetical protein